VRAIEHLLKSRYVHLRKDSPERALLLHLCTNLNFAEKFRALAAKCIQGLLVDTHTVRKLSMEHPYKHEKTSWEP
jgi:hypothetical protein